MKKDKVLVDSGERVVFEGGAQREIVYGKGRCDLLPLDTIYTLTGDEFFLYMNHFMIHGDRESIEKAFRCAVNFVYSGSYGNAILGAAHQYEDGAIKYAENNWRKGLPLKSFIDSGVRHYLKFMAGHEDEPHDRAVIWNLLGLLWTYDRHQFLEEFPMFRTK